MNFFDFEGKDLDTILSLDKYISNYATFIFNTFNGRVNKVCPCLDFKVRFVSHLGINVRGTANIFQLTIRLFSGSFIKAFIENDCDGNSGYYDLKLNIIYTVIHELYHLDQAYSSIIEYSHSSVDKNVSLESSLNNINEAECDVFVRNFMNINIDFIDSLLINDSTSGFKQGMGIFDYADETKEVFEVNNKGIIPLSKIPRPMTNVEYIFIRLFVMMFGVPSDDVIYSFDVHPDITLKCHGMPDFVLKRNNVICCSVENAINYIQYAHIQMASGDVISKTLRKYDLDFSREMIIEFVPMSTMFDSIKLPSVDAIEFV